MGHGWGEKSPYSFLLSVLPITQSNSTMVSAWNRHFDQKTFGVYVSTCAYYGTIFRFIRYNLFQVTAPYADLIFCLFISLHALKKYYLKARLCFLL